MNIFSILKKNFSAKTGVFLLDADSDKLITKICKFNPYHLDSKFKHEFSELLKKKYLNNNGKDLTIKSVALWKLIFYAQLIEGSPYSDEVKVFHEIKKGISVLYDDVKNDYPDLALNAAIFLS